MVCLKFTDVDFFINNHLLIYQYLNMYPLTNQVSMPHSKNIMFHWNIKGIVGVYNAAYTDFGLAQYYRYYMLVRV